MANDSYIVELVVNVQQDEAIRRLMADMKKMNTEVAKSNKTAQTSTKGFKQMGYQIQNMSYQMTDFIVMVQGGIAPLRAFSQQAPQLLAGFGPAGAAIGVVAALLPAMFMAMGKGKAAMETLSQSTENATDALEAYQRSIRDLTYNNRAAAGSVLQLRQSIATLELEDLKEKLDPEPITIWGAAWIAVKDTFKALLTASVDFYDYIAEKLSDSKLAAYADSIKDSYEQIESAQERLKRQAGNFLLTNPDDYENLRKVAPLYQQMLKLRRDAIAAGEPIPEEFEKVFGILESNFNRLQGIMHEYADNAERAMSGPIHDLLKEQDKLWTDVQRGLLSTSEYYALLNEAAVKYQETLDQTKTMGEQLMEGGMRIVDSFVNGLAQGTAKVKDLFKNMVKALIAELLKLMAYRAVFSMLGGWGTDLGNQFGNAAGMGQRGWRPAGTQAHGGAWEGGVQKFATGGIVGGPTLFPMRNGMGLMGEAGPEAIMPLKRMSGGDLGVKAAPVNVTVNNMAGVDVTAVPDGNGGLTLDIIRRAIAGDIQNGGNMVSDSIGRSFGLSRGAGAY